MIAKDRKRRTAVPKEKISMPAILNANKAITAKVKIVIEKLENKENADKEIKELMRLLDSTERTIENSF